MPAINPVTGILEYQPGVRKGSRLVTSLGGQAPAFLTPLVIGGAYEGYPYNANSLKYSSENDIPFYHTHGTAESLADENGWGCPIHTFARYAKRTGLPLIHAVCASALTRASILVTSTGPVNQFTIYATKFGAPGSHIKLAFDGTNFTIVPLKSFAMLSANLSSSGLRMYIAGVDPLSWVAIGKTYWIGDNNSTDEEFVVRDMGYEINTSGQKQWWIDLTTSTGTAYAVNDYAMIWEYEGAAGTLTSPDIGAGQGQVLIDWINSTAYKHVRAHRHANFTGVVPITAATLTPLKEISAWGTATAGTSPAATNTDYQAITTLLSGTGLTDFMSAVGTYPYVYGVAENSSTIHGTMADYAAAQRSEGRPLTVITGCRYTDVDTAASDDTNPIYRANALGSQDMVLCAGQVDRIEPSLSLAGEALGAIVAADVGGDITRDRVAYTYVGKRWTSTELTALLRGGVLTYAPSRGKLGDTAFLYRFAQDVNTYPGGRDGAYVTGTSVPVTGLGQTRRLLDYINAVMGEAAEPYVAAATVTRATLASHIMAQGKRLLFDRGLVTEPVTINSIARDTTGTVWEVTPRVKITGPNHFINVVTFIVAE